ncbi:hypothetical protein GOODEAATRI_015906 [Goodea atripinnis]|uniref:Uncharacterized protein n=1 Tax=Goodea atripinnis TaxID=208336 RepID=A0ABV0NV10_9TELE
MSHTLCLNELLRSDSTVDVGVSQQSQKELSSHIRLTVSKSQPSFREMVSGTEKREGVLYFNASLFIRDTGMDLWTVKDLSHISLPQTATQQRKTHCPLCDK